MLIDGNTLRAAIDAGVIEVYRTRPIDRAQLRLDVGHLLIGPNSIDVTLGHEMLFPEHQTILDPRNATSVVYHALSLADTYNGPAFLLMPQVVYLGFAAERFIVHDQLRGSPVVQMLDGRSTVGRIGITVHVTAGFGDVGFAGNFTLEVVNLNCVPVLLYPGMRIGQVAFHQVTASNEQLQYTGAYKADHIGRPVPPKLGRDRF